MFLYAFLINEFLLLTFRKYNDLRHWKHSSYCWKLKFFHAVFSFEFVDKISQSMIIWCKIPSRKSKNSFISEICVSIQLLSSTLNFRKKVPVRKLHDLYWPLRIAQGMLLMKRHLAHLIRVVAAILITLEGNQKLLQKKHHSLRI